MNGTAGTSWERPDAPLGTLVYRAGLLSKDKLEAALAEGQQTGRRLGEILLQKGWIEEKDLARLLAGQRGLAFVSLKGRGFDPELARRLTERTSRYHCALAMEEEGSTLLVAIADPTDESAVAEIEAELGKGFRLVVATASEIRSAHDQVFVDAPAPVAAVVPITPASDAHADVSAFGLRVAPAAPDGPDAPEPEQRDDAPDPFDAVRNAATETPGSGTRGLVEGPAERDAEPEREPERDFAVAAAPEAEPEPEPEPEPKPLLSLGGLVSAAPEEDLPNVSPEPPAAGPDVAVVHDPSAVFGADRPAPPVSAAADGDRPAETPSIVPAPSVDEPTIQRNEERHVSVAFHAPALLREPEPEAERYPEPESERDRETEAEREPESEPHAAAAPDLEPLRAAEPVASPAPEGTDDLAAHPLRVVLVLEDDTEMEVGSYADEPGAEAAARGLIAQMARPEGWPRIGNRFLRPDRIVSIDIRERRSWTGSRARAAWAGEAQRAEP